MIVPASIADWTMFAGLLASLSGIALLGYPRILEGQPDEPAFAERAAPHQRERTAA